MPETIQTVGIDIGTTTTSLVLAQLSIQNTEAFSSLPHVQIVDKQINYRSPVIFTPLIGAKRINQEALQAFVAHQYQIAKINKADLKMGAIIMTGETARKQNARRILQSLSQFAGNFVCATAGPRLESFIAGKGANQTLLKRHPEIPVINLDIGGGTTNMAYFKNGDCMDTACFDIGGRLIRVNDHRQITYIAPKLQKIISSLALPIHLGDTATPAILQPLIDEMVRALVKMVGGTQPAPFYNLLQTDPLNHPVNQDALITFSGGVSDCFFSKLPTNPFKYGDIGILLGHAIKTSTFFKAKHIGHPTETIGATVIGAGSQTVTVSGSTIRYSSNALPLRNVPVISLDQSKVTDINPVIEDKLMLYDLPELAAIGIALQHVGANFQAITKQAADLASGLTNLIRMKVPLVILMEKNVALFFGNCFREHIPKDYPLVCLDAVSTKDGDYIDIGRPVANGQALPLIIKTLAFN